MLEMVAAMERASGRPIKYVIGERRPGDLDEVYSDPSKVGLGFGLFCSFWRVVVGVWVGVCVGKCMSVWCRCPEVWTMSTRTPARLGRHCGWLVG